MPTSAIDVTTALWLDAGMPAAALDRLVLTGREPVLATSFAAATAAQASIAGAALASTEIGRERNGLVQRASVDLLDAAVECTGHFEIDGRVPDLWDKLSGLYRCRDGWVRIHANFAHHRDGALRLLGLPAGPDTPRAAAEAAALQRSAFELEEAAAQAGLVIAALRSFEQWDAHPQGRAVASLPLLSWEKIGEAAPRPLPPLEVVDPPLHGLRVLELTRILAGPTCGRTLAGYGADVMLVNGPHLPNIEHIIETSRGKRSCQLDLRTAEGRKGLRDLLAQADAFIQGYRPGGLGDLGFGPEDAAQIRPGLVYISLSAYGHVGPWAGRRGFDSLVQTATGFNDAEMHAAGEARPRPMPVQILDYASGFLMAFAMQAARLRQAREGGSWHVRIGLAQTARWLRSMGRVDGGMAAPKPDVTPRLETSRSGWGELRALRHGAQLSHTPVRWRRPSMPPGSHPARWDDT